MHDRRTFLAGMAAAVVAGGQVRIARASQSGGLLVSVLTCPRPRGVSYLDGTLKSIDAEVAADVPRLLVCDGEEVLADGWTSAVVPARPKCRGKLPDNKFPGWVALRAAWAMGADLMFCEDDIRALHPGAFAAMVEHEVADDMAFTSFFARERPAGSHPVREFMYSQAVKIPHRSLGYLVDADKQKPFLWSLVAGVDLAIGTIGGFYRWKFEQTPNLVEHIGLWSAANPPL
jgi:hypothetical protein